MDQTEHNTVNSLKIVGIAPEDITDVFITHLHFDHVGGATCRDEQNNPHLTYPNAMHYVQKKHWDWSHNPTQKDGGSFIRDLIDPLKDSGKLELLDGPGKLFPNMETVVVNGHTEAQHLPYISDGKNSLLFCGDLVPTSAHIGYPWIMAYDNQPLVTLKEKQEWLPRMHDEGGYLFFGHDPHIAYGKLTKNENGRFQLQDPVKSP